MRQLFRRIVYVFATSITVGVCYYKMPVMAEKGTYYNPGLLYKIPPLIRAATFGDADVFKKLIHNGVSVDLEDRDGNTSLSLIVMNMNYPHARKMLGIILPLHPNMRVKSKDGLMPIHMASRIDAAIGAATGGKRLQHDTIAKLVEFGAKMTDKDGKGYTILDRIVERYERQGAKSLLDVLGPLMADQMLEDSIQIATERQFRDPRDYALKKGRRKIADMDPVKVDPQIGFNGCIVQ